MLHKMYVLNQRYQIVQKIGGGGFGDIYLAQDLKRHTQCVVKENLDPSPEAQSQFVREYAILLRLQHLNLVRVIDYFIDPSGQQYLVMDYIEGQDLEEILKQRGALPEKEVLPWVVQICDALTYLHAQKPPVIHRDIKPANIKITPLGRAVLVDFGIAKVFEPVEGTVSGARAVTLGYSPPEQYSGQGKTDGRSDIYSLGATLYALLTNQIPVESVERVAGQTLALPHTLRANVSSPVEHAVLKAMELAPARRFQHAEEFKAALFGKKPHFDLLAWVRATRNQILAGVVPLGLLALVGLSLLLFAALSRMRTRPMEMGLVAENAQPTSISTPTLRLGTQPVPATKVTPPPCEWVTHTWTSPVDEADMLCVPAGKFLMGSLPEDNAAAPDEKPQTQKDLPAFWMDKYEVTNALFKRFVDDTGYQTETEQYGKGDVYNDKKRRWESVKGASWQHPRGPASNLDDLEQVPVVLATHADAAAFCTWAGKRLPKEDEWEKAARGTDGWIYPWGKEQPNGKLLNFAGKNLVSSPDVNDESDPPDGYFFTAPVGTFPDGQSPYQLMDMAGNVWEWTDTIYQEGADAASTKYVVRGGSWYSASQIVRAANRASNFATERIDDVGFRCVIAP